MFLQSPRWKVLQATVLFDPGFPGMAQLNLLNVTLSSKHFIEDFSIEEEFQVNCTQFIIACSITQILSALGLQREITNVCMNKRMGGDLTLGFSL